MLLVFKKVQKRINVDGITTYLTVVVNIFYNMYTTNICNLIIISIIAVYSNYAVDSYHNIQKYFFLYTFYK